MVLEERPMMMQAVIERDTSLVIIQLLDTSSEFREWFVDQFLPDEAVDRYLSASYSVADGTGESDIEFGFETPRGERVLLLIENKIDAEIQPDQAERYYDRGDGYLEKNLCDQFLVGLLAPTQYVNDTHQERFGTVVTYDSIQDHLEGSSYDGAPYITKLLKLASEKQKRTYSESAVVQEIVQQFQSQRDRFPDLNLITPADGQVLRFQSTASDHPDAIGYSIWVNHSVDDREAMVRMGIDTDAPEDVIASLEEFLEENCSGLEGFSVMGNPPRYKLKTIVRTGWDRPVTNSEYIEEILEELRRLVTYLNPRLKDYTAE